MKQFFSLFTDQTQVTNTITIAQAAWSTVAVFLVFVVVFTLLAKFQKINK